MMTNEGSDLYLWGASDWSTSTDSKQDSTHRILDFPLYLPLRVSLGEVTDISCGAKFMLLLTKSRNVFGFGNNEFGQLGFGTRETSLIPYPVQINIAPNQRVSKISAGYAHTLALTEDGFVYTTGNNNYKQLGNCSNPCRDKWCPVIIKEAACAIATGRESSYLLTFSGMVYSWGNSRNGCLGHGAFTQGKDGELSAPIVKNPQKIDFFVDRDLQVIKICAGSYHFVALTSSGDIYTCGEGTYGRLGHGKTSSRWEPDIISHFPRRQYPEKVINIFAGGEITFVLRECAILGVMIYVFGRIGNDYQGYLAPELLVELSGLDLCGVACGKNHQIAWTRTGDVYGWGKNSKCSSNGALADQKKKMREPHLLALLQDHHVVSAGCGSHHTLVAAQSVDQRSKEIKIPLDSRYSHHLPSNKVPFETVAEEYRSLFLGEIEGKQYNSTVSTRSPVLEETVRLKLGTHNLRTGSKVQVWLEDVYALGIILRISEVNRRRSFEVYWLREDWDDEIISLNSTDETDDESNPNRWRHGWS